MGNGIIPGFIKINENANLYYEEVKLILEEKKYILKDYLGEGAFGVAYKIEEINTKNLFCCKIISLQHLQNECNVSDVKPIVLNEVQSLSRTGSIMSIVRYSSYFMTDKYCLIIMELIDGVTLDKFILNFNDNWGLEYKIISCVYELHNLGIIHCDLKPSNIFILSDGCTIKVGDLGLSIILGDGKSQVSLSSMRHINGGGGTQRYLPPELRYNNNNNNINTLYSDIWSIGVILIDLIFGYERILEDDIRTRKNIEIIKEELNDKKSLEYQELLPLINNLLLIDINKRQLTDELLKNKIFIYYNDIFDEIKQNNLKILMKHKIFYELINSSNEYKILNNLTNKDEIWMFKEIKQINDYNEKGLGYSYRLYL